MIISVATCSSQYLLRYIDPWSWASVECTRGEAGPALSDSVDDGGWEG